MPCIYDPTPEEITQSEIARKQRKKEQLVAWDGLKKKIDKLTRFLCELNAEIDHEYSHTGFEPIGRSQEIRDWWKQHQKDDAKRKANKKQRQAERRAKELEKVEKARQRYEKLKKRYGRK